MKKFGKDKLADVEIYLGESNEQIREGMRSTLRDYGLRRVRTFARMVDLINAIKELPPDLLIVSDDIDATVFDAVRDIRHFKIGRNPFMMISLLVTAENEGAVKHAILAGADDVMIMPNAPPRTIGSRPNTTRLAIMIKAPTMPLFPTAASVMRCTFQMKPPAYTLSSTPIRLVLANSAKSERYNASDSISRDSRVH